MNNYSNCQISRRYFCSLIGKLTNIYKFRFCIAETLTSLSDVLLSRSALLLWFGAIRLQAEQVSP